MKIFLDSANIDEIIEINDLNIIDGLTTNPSLIAKEGKDFRKSIIEICQIIKVNVSVEVTSNKFELMLQEADKILSLANNIIIKLPMTWEGIKACKYLSTRGKKVNMTLCFTSNQALLAAKAGAAYISPFIGRLEDIGEDGMKLIKDIKHIYSNYNFSTQILVASIRNSHHFYQAAYYGADVATLSGKIIKQLMHHTLTDLGLEIFDRDWGASNLVI